MTWPVVGAFLVTFVADPLLCAGLLRLPSTLRVLAGLAMAVVAGMGAALWLEPRAPLPSLLLLWAGWVTAVAMVGHALYRRLVPPRCVPRLVSGDSRRFRIECSRCPPDGLGS